MLTNDDLRISCFVEKQSNGFTHPILNSLRPSKIDNNNYIAIHVIISSIASSTVIYEHLLISYCEAPRLLRPIHEQNKSNPLDDYSSSSPMNSSLLFF